MEKIKKIINKWNPIYETRKFKETIEKLYKDPRVIPFIYTNIYNRVVKAGLTKRNVWGLLILKGPRRIGKTTLLFYIVNRLLNDIKRRFVKLRKIDILYLSLDDKDLDSNVLEEILINFLNKKGKKLILLDEASFIPEWNIILKNLIDRGLTRDSIIIVTGSYGVDLEESERLLYGRYGNLYSLKKSLKSGPFQFFFPIRFSELISRFRVYEELKDFLIESGLINNKSLPNIRENVLEVLSSKYSDIYSLSSINNHTLKTIKTFFNAFILTGGF